VINLRAHNLINCDVSLKIRPRSKVDVMAVKVKPYLFFLHFSIIMPYKRQRILAGYLEAENSGFSICIA